MKTAMELALARIEILYIEKDSIHWEVFKNNCIEKEKEQIMRDYRNGKVEAKMPNEVNTTGTEYYNQTYNK
jgi:hypothetical protein